MRSLLFGLALILSATAVAQAPSTGGANASATPQHSRSLQGATPLRIPGQKLAPRPTPRPPVIVPSIAALKAQWMD